MLPRENELTRGSPFERSLEIRMVIEGEVGAGVCSDVTSEIIDVSGLKASDAELIEDGQEEANGADGHEWVGIIDAKDSTSGTEEQGCAHPLKGVSL